MAALPTSTSEPLVTPRRILAFWLPLAATWLMMSAEGPFLTALMARLPQAKFNLAAFGVAFSLAMLVEAPIIMIMSAAAALVHGRASFLALRRFIYALNTGITAVMLVLVVPPVFRALAQGLIGLPADVAGLAHLGLALLLPWPAAIGYRRFYQGVLIRHGDTRRVAYGTVVRLATMAVCGGALYAWTRLPGIAVGAAALSIGVVCEAAASRVMAAGAVRSLLAGPEGPALPLPAIARFYYPLAVTSLLTLGMQPLLTFFLGQSRYAIESLAVLPVVHALVFVFRSSGLALQEVVIVLIGRSRENAPPLRRFAGVLAAATSAALALLAFTPLARLWLGAVAGLAPELAAFAYVPLRIMCLMPALEVLLSWQRSLLVVEHRTGLVTGGTGVEIGAAVAVLSVAIGAVDLVGATAAAIAIVAARLAANAFLAWRLSRAST
jgi:progressive ankylosis protein